MVSDVAFRALSNDKFDQEKILRELAKRVAIKAPESGGNLDYEDNERLAQLFQMTTGDIDQTLRAKKHAEAMGGWFAERNPVIKNVVENGDPGALRLAAGAGTMALAKRWMDMENPMQRKIEMLTALAIEAGALKSSVDNYPKSMQKYVPPFRVTLFGRKF